MNKWWGDSSPAVFCSCNSELTTQHDFREGSKTTRHGFEAPKFPNEVVEMVEHEELNTPFDDDDNMAVATTPITCSNGSCKTPTKAPISHTLIWNPVPENSNSKRSNSLHTVFRIGWKQERAIAHFSREMVNHHSQPTSLNCCTIWQMHNPVVSERYLLLQSVVWMNSEDGWTFDELSSPL